MRTLALLVGLSLAALVTPAVAQQPAPAAPDPVTVMAEGLADALERLTVLEAATKKDVAAIRAQATVDRSRFAAALYRVAGADDPDGRGKKFGQSPPKQEGSLFAAADGLASRIRARDEVAALPAAVPASDPAQPAPTVPAAAPVTPAPAATGPPVPPAPRPAAQAPTRDQQIAAALERLTAELAGITRLLRQPQ